MHAVNISLNKNSFNKFKNSYIELETELDDLKKVNVDLENANETLKDILRKTTDESKSVKTAFEIELNEVRESYKKAESDWY